MHMTSDNLLSGPERPITGRDEDRLDRGAFVRRLADALVDKETSAARGVVIGVTGAWGSGKSSVLNMIAEDIAQRHPKAVVVRFDPWLVSGQQDLILAFLHQTIATLRDEPQRAKNARTLITTLGVYGSSLSPLLNVKFPGLGTAIKGGIDGLTAWLKVRSESLQGQRKRLTEAMESFGAPIVVLIDELDRVEDAEVRTVAQLVRAVGDFSGISYLLAYDPARVARALGDQDEARGRAYLEKIVQLAVPLPISLPDELRRLVDAEISAVWADLGVESVLTDDPRYRALAQAMIPALIETPRDIKRLVGAFHPLAAMVQGEVDLVDVVGFAALLVKAPRTVERIRAMPERCVVDPLSYEEHAYRITNGNGRRDGLADILDPEEPKARGLMLRLFEATHTEISADAVHADGLSRRRALMTMLRLGVLPGEVSRGEAETLLAGGAEEVASSLTSMLEADTIGPLIDRISEIYPDHVADNDQGFWDGARDVLNVVEAPLNERFGQRINVAKELCDVLLAAFGRAADYRWKGANLVIGLARGDDLALTPIWLHSHFFVHGSFGARKDGGRNWFLDIAQTNNLAVDLGTRWRDQLVQAKLMPRLVNAFPLYIMLRTGAWNSECRAALIEQLPDHIIRLAACLFPPGGATERATIEDLCGYDAFVGAVKTALGRDDLTPTEQYALKGATQNIWNGGVEVEDAEAE